MGINLKAHHALISEMSPALKGEVLHMMDNSWIEKVPFFRGTQVGFVIQVAVSLEQMAYPVRQRRRRRRRRLEHIRLTVFVCSVPVCVIQGGGAG